jgi:hypothetical protein
MSKFKAGAGGIPAGGSRFKNINRIVKEGVLWVPPFLSESKSPQDKVRTEIRLYPPVQDGELYDAIRCEPVEAMEALPLREKLSDVFLNVEMARFVGGLDGQGMTTDMITSVFDDNGAAIGGFTPYRSFVFRLREKISEQLVLAAAGETTDIPNTWFRYKNEGGKRGREWSLLSWPYGGGSRRRDTEEASVDPYLVQCIALYINGAERKDPETGKLRRQGPCVFALPMSGAPAFFDALLTPLDADAPVSYVNNQFGDCFSLTQGRVLQLKKLPAKANGSSDYVLRLGMQEPLTLAQVTAMYRPWSELVNLPSPEESIRWIAEAFGDPVMVDYAFREVPGDKRSGKWAQYIPEEWRGLACDIAEPLSDVAATIASHLVDDASTADDADDLSYSAPAESAAKVKVKMPRPALKPVIGKALLTDKPDLSDAPAGIDVERYQAALQAMQKRLAAPDKTIDVDADVSADVEDSGSLSDDFE